MMNNSEAISDFVSQKLNTLQSDNPESKAALARLRRGVGKDISDAPDAWMLVLNGMPEQLMNTSATPSNPSSAELAVYTALTLFAVHQQGTSKSVNESEVSLGGAAGRLRDATDSNGVKRRFNAVLTSNDVVELSYHARGLIKLIRSSNTNTGLDYPMLAKDLYNYQFPDSKRRTILKWGQDYYKVESDNEDNEKA